MYRPLLALLVAVPVSAAPAVKGTGGPLYFPTQVGAKTVMEISVDGALLGKNPGAFEVTETVSAVEVKDGTYRVTVERESKGNFVTVYEVSAKGVFRVASGGSALAEPVPLLKLPARPGDTWKTASGTATVGKEEEIEVPAGKFKAIPVTTERETAGRTVKTTTWLAPDVGVVKRVGTVNDITTVYVLKSFTPGK
jgi:hypothetical protein